MDISICFGTQTGTKTNGYQNVKVSKLKSFDATTVLIPPLGAAIETPQRVPKQTGTKMPSFQKSKTCHFDTPTCLLQSISLGEGGRMPYDCASEISSTVFSRPKHDHDHFSAHLAEPCSSILGHPWMLHQMPLLHIGTQRRHKGLSSDAPC